jgi:hypothetical protein
MVNAKLEPLTSPRLIRSATSRAIESFGLMSTVYARPRWPLDIHLLGGFDEPNIQRLGEGTLRGDTQPRRCSYFLRHASLTPNLLVVTIPNKIAILSCMTLSDEAKEIQTHLARMKQLVDDLEQAGAENDQRDVLAKLRWEIEATRRIVTLPR